MSHSKHPTPPIRVLLITSGFAIDGPLGGIERFGLELSKNIDTAKVDVTLLGMWAYGVENEQTWLKHAQAAGVNAIMPTQWDESSPTKSFWRCLVDTRNMLQGERFDIIHSHCQFGDVLALCLKRFLGAKTLLRTVHNEKEWPRRQYRRQLLTNFLLPLTYKAEYGVSDQVVANLNSRRLTNRLNKPAGVLNNALNATQMEQKLAKVVDVDQLKAELGVPTNGRIIGSVGRLVEQKGYAFLIDAAVELCKTFDDLYFVIAGDGPLKDGLQAKVDRLGLQKRFLFAGPRSDIESLYKIFDIFVSCSLWEGLPTVIMESLYAKIPVVATRVSGNIELVLDKKTGILVEPHSADSLIEGMTELLNLSNSAIYSLRQNGKEHITEHFTFKQVAVKHEQIYQESLSGSG
ncbi:MAG: glycosyltransferase family 4 protein [Anaerolineae bacterium]